MSLVRVDTVITQLIRRDASAHAQLKTATAQMVEHADFFGQPQGVVKGQGVDQWSKQQALGSLSHRRMEHRRRR